MTTADTDRLPLARRLDWRFLLADPRLGRVALVGDAALQLTQPYLVKLAIDQYIARGDLPARAGATLLLHSVSGLAALTAEINVDLPAFG